MIPGGIYKRLLAVSKIESGGFLNLPDVRQTAGDRAPLCELATVVHTKKNSVEI